MSEARKMVIREMLIMRSQGYTDGEIALKYGLHRVTVNRMINGAPPDVKERLARLGLV